MGVVCLDSNRLPWWGHNTHISTPVRRLRLPSNRTFTCPLMTQTKQTIKSCQHNRYADWICVLFADCRADWTGKGRAGSWNIGGSSSLRWGSSLDNRFDKENAAVLEATGLYMAAIKPTVVLRLRSVSCTIFSDFYFKPLFFIIWCGFAYLFSYYSLGVISK